MSYKVFISSTQRDIDVARDLVRRLEEAGVRVFPVEDTSVPEEKAASVTRSLREADEVIVILTGNSVNSPNLIYEMGAASGLPKRVTPLVVNVKDSEIPPFVKTYVRFAELPSFIAELAKRAATITPQTA
jgi:TIR domain-containing protein